MEPDCLLPATTAALRQRMKLLSGSQDRPTVFASILDVSEAASAHRSGHVAFVA